MTAPALIRDAVRVQAALQELPDGRVVALAPVKIYVPLRYVDRNLAVVGVENHILGIYAITVEDKYYGVSLINAMVPIEPSQTNKVKMDGDDFLEFVFETGSTVIKSLDLVCVDTLTYRIYDEILAKGNIPWYLGYEELAALFNTAKKHADANVGQEQEVIQLIVSLVARSREDRTKYYRTVVQSLEDLHNKPPVFVPLMSVRYSATNTLNKLAGSYFGQGVVSALLNPAERTERIENLLRK
jgi:hypothetical protein